MRLNYLAIVITAFIVLALFLSLVGIISFSFSTILAYSLIIIGIYFVYSEIIRQNIFLIFAGSVIFLAGTYFLVVDYFNLQMRGGMLVPVMLMFTGSGLFIVYITSRINKIFLFLSIILLTAGITLTILQSHFRFGSFLLAVFPVFNFLWPVIIIAALIIFLVRSKT